jgi:hypothetical protein
LYRWLRNTHLLLGLASSLVLALYGLSAIQMSHRTWLVPRVVEKSTASFPISVSEGADVTEVARELMIRYGLTGDLRDVKQIGNTFRFSILRADIEYDVDYNPVDRAAKVVTRKTNWIGKINRMHHAAGLWHQSASLNLWGVLVALVSASLIVISLTGIYLWFKMNQERVIGTILLTLGLAVSLTLIVMLRAA